MVKVKICGIKRLEDGLAAAEAGADLIGLNFYRSSPRYIHPVDARRLADGMRAELGAACPVLVGVFVNEIVGRMSITMEQVGLKFVQLSGDESGEMLRELRGTGYKAIRPRTVQEAVDDAMYFDQYAPADDRVPSLLLDAHHPALYGGTGEQASIDVARAARDLTPRLMLAGGLRPDNVQAIITAVQPWGVDVASGVEVEGQQGIKDREKMRAFIQAVKMVEW
ncbi:MAG: phosphoribosylanthranilate isomerase [Aggregatilineales bacterium]